MAYTVSLKQFDGPLDLLLTLIGKARIDIQEIFVSEITEQYLAYMAGVDELDMETRQRISADGRHAAGNQEPRHAAQAPPGRRTRKALRPEEALVRQLTEYKQVQGSLPGNAEAGEAKPARNIDQIAGGIPPAPRRRWRSPGSPWKSSPRAFRAGAEARWRQSRSRLRGQPASISAAIRYTVGRLHGAHRAAWCARAAAPLPPCSTMPPTARRGDHHVHGTSGDGQAQSPARRAAGGV